MIIWIASYPRSGNTLTTQVLNKCFGVRVYEKYNDFNGILTPLEGKRIGVKRFKGSWEKFYEEAKHSEKLFFIKTHDRPDDQCLCIYVVRNGLHATESYFAYNRDISKNSYTYENIIMGSVFPFLSWGSHLDEWSPMKRNQTLLVRYEDIIRDPDSIVTAIETFTGKKREEPWINEFESYRQKNPSFFRKGTTDQNLALSAETSELFNLVNGDWMYNLGYSASSLYPACPALRKKMRISFTEVVMKLQQTEEELQRHRRKRDNLMLKSELVRLFKHYFEKYKKTTSER